MSDDPKQISMRKALIFLPLAALIVVSPLLLGGCSCGHDFLFHIQSWLDAASQLRDGTLLPHWTFSSAWNAGEPRFLFYPPLSWMLGELLSLLAPIKLVTTAYTWIALTVAGLTMFRLARHFVVSANIAIAASVIYLANPYMLFTAFERTAYAELLAAAWMPMLLLAILRERPTVRGIALPVALLWLTNAPAAVMGCYAMTFVLTLRFALSLRRHSSHHHAAASHWHILVSGVSGTLLALGLAAFYFVPAAYERRFVQIAMAVGPGLSPAQSFLFGHTADTAHDAVLHTASLIAVTLIIASIALLAIAKYQPRSNANQNESSSSQLILLLSALVFAIGILLTRPSLWLWKHLPELSFLQFPWRLLAVLAVVACLAAALTLRNAASSLRTLSLGTFAIVIGVTTVSIHNFRQPCDTTDFPSARLALFHEHHGTAPTDEYTPNNADNDQLRTDDPPYWVADDPTATAAGTTPNPHELDPDSDVDDLAAPVNAHLSATPLHLSVTLPTAEFLVLNLRNYPQWSITRNHTQHLATVQRDDGLIAVALPAGTSQIDIAWHRSRDENLGAGISIFSLLTFAGLAAIERKRFAVSRRIEG